MIRLLDALLSLPFLLGLATTIFVLGVARGIVRKRRVGGPRRVLVLGVSSADAIQKSGVQDEIVELACLDGRIETNYLCYFDFDAASDRDVSLTSGEGRMECMAIAAHPGGRLKSLGLRRLNTILANLNLIRRLLRLVKTEGVCAVRAMNPHLHGGNGILVATLSRLPLIIQVCSNYDEKDRRAKGVANRVFRYAFVERSFERFALRSADIVCADRYDYLNKGLIPKACLPRYQALTFSVRAPHYAEPQYDDDFAQRLSVEGKRIISYVGRLNPVKLVEDLVPAAARLLEESKDVVLVIAGEGSEREAIVDQARKAGVSDQVHFVGYLSTEETARLFRISSAALFPSAGYTLVEAALAAIPIIAYDFEWHGEFLEDGVGILVPFRDIGGLEKGLRRVLADDDLAHRLGQAARNAALDKHTRSAELMSERGLWGRALGVEV